MLSVIAAPIFPATTLASENLFFSDASPLEVPEPILAGRWQQLSNGWHNFSLGGIFFPPTLPPPFDLQRDDKEKIVRVTGPLVENIPALEQLLDHHYGWEINLTAHPIATAETINEHVDLWNTLTKQASHYPRITLNLTAHTWFATEEKTTSLYLHGQEVALATHLLHYYRRAEPNQPFQINGNKDLPSSVKNWFHAAFLQPAPESQIGKVYAVLAQAGDPRRTAPAFRNNEPLQQTRIFLMAEQARVTAYHHDWQWAVQHVSGPGDRDRLTEAVKTVEAWLPIWTIPINAVAVLMEHGKLHIIPLSFLNGHFDEMREQLTPRVSSSPPAIALNRRSSDLEQRLFGDMDEEGQAEEAATVVDAELQSQLHALDQQRQNFEGQPPRLPSPPKQPKK